MRRFREIKNFGLGRLHTRAFTLQEVEILLTLVYFHYKGLILGIMWCRGPKALFGCVKRLYMQFCGSVVAGFMAQFVKCPWYAQSMV